MVFQVLQHQAVFSFPDYEYRVIYPDPVTAGYLLSEIGFCKGAFQNNGILVRDIGPLGVFHPYAIIKAAVGIGIYLGNGLKCYIK